MDSCFSFRVTRFRRHANPLQLALQGLLPLAFRFLFASQTLLLLFQPRRVVTLPRNSLATIKLENPSGDVIEEVTIVSNCNHSPGVALQMVLKPRNRFCVEMIRW